MSHQTALIILSASLIWSVAVLVKAGRAFVGGYGYHFSRWDGGTMRAGQTLSRTGTRIKLVLSSLLVFGIVGLLTRLLPLRGGPIIVCAVVAVTVISDSLTIEVR